MVKLHVLGGPGSGKTTLARHVSSSLAVPHYDLDQLGRKYGPHAAPLVEDVVAIARQPGWVTEGIYLFFTEPLLQAADYVVVLEVGWFTAAWRIVRRHVVASLRGTNQYPGWNGWKALFNLLRYARSYYLNQRLDTAAAERLFLAERSAMTELSDTDAVIAYTEKHAALVIPPSAQFVRLYLAVYGGKVVWVKNAAHQKRLLNLLEQSSSTRERTG